MLEDINNTIQNNSNKLSLYIDSILKNNNIDENIKSKIIEYIDVKHNDMLNNINDIVSKKRKFNDLNQDYPIGHGCGC